MKKFFLIIMFFVSMSYINAFELTYSEWSEEYPQGLNEILIQSEERYLWYKETIYDIEYLKLEDIGNKLYDVNDFEYFESDEVDYVPQEYSERQINRIVKQIIYSKDDIAGISLNDINENISISEITISKDGVPVNYVTDFGYLNDGVLDEYHPLIEEVHLYFDKKYDVEDLYINVYYNKNTEGYEKLSINYIANTNDIIYYIDYKIDLCQTTNCSLTPNTSIWRDSLYHDRIVYQYIDKLYKTYRKDIDYCDEYLANKEGYEKVEGSAKTFYRYITNEYIILDASDNIVTDDNYCTKSFCKAVFLNKQDTQNVEEPTINNDEEPPVNNNEEPITNNEEDPPVNNEPTIIENETNDETIINPKTYDPIYDYVILLIISILAIIFFFVKQCRTNK